MIALLRHAWRLVLREPRRSAATVGGTTLAAALIASLLLFGAASGSTVTRRALADLPVDGQVVLAASSEGLPAQAIVKADPAVRSVTPFDLAHFDSAELSRAGSATQTSAGVLLGVDAEYTATTGLFPLSSGARIPGQVAISRDLASNLGAVPGDPVRFHLAGGAEVVLKVSGIVSITGADLLLGPIDPAHRAAGANPPTNVALMSRSDLERLVLTRIPAGTVANDPGSGAGGQGNPSPVFAPEPAVRRELHLQLDHAQLPGDPVEAQRWLDGVRRRLERQGAGTFTVVDDASASLEPVAADLVWGQILFLFLALPGIALALALSGLAADATGDATRRQAALLRARGATATEVRVIFVGAALLTAVIGALAGTLIGSLVGVGLLGLTQSTPDVLGTTIRSGLLAFVLTAALAGFSASLPLRGQLAEEIAAGRHELQRDRSPLWRRLRLDLLLIIGGVALYLLVGGAGVHPVLGAEGNPTVTLTLTAFLAPFLLWSGGTLLALRGAGWFIRGGRRLDPLLSRLLGPGGSLASASLAARVKVASRTIVVLALAIGFASSVLIFGATYGAQQRVDAALTLGADLKATPTDASTADVARHLIGPGIAAVTPFVDRVVYVGPEAQDLLAIDAGTLAQAAPLADSFFGSTTAEGAMAALRAQPDAILVSAETAKDYSMVPGDRVRIRVPDGKGGLTTVDFRMAGIALEFPTAPKDAFLVANLAYVAAQTGDGTISFVLARADGRVATAAARLVHRLGAGWQVTSIDSVAARLSNSITSVDLAGLVAIDLVFGLVIAAIGTALFLVAGLAERRRELATLVAIGAEPGQVRALIAGESIVVGVAGMAAGLLMGGLLGLALVQILGGVFDPAPTLPTYPIVPILAVAGGVALTIGLAVAVADRAIARLSVVAALRER